MALTLAGIIATLWPIAINPRFSYQCATSVRTAWRSTSGTSVAAGPKPISTSSSMPEAARPGASKAYAGGTITPPAVSMTNVSASMAAALPTES